MPSQAAPRPSLALLGALAFSGISAFTIHVGLLTLGIPYPIATPPGWAIWASSLSSITALLVTLRMGRKKLLELSFARQWLMAFLILSMVRETLRAAIMHGVVTGGAVIPLLGLGESLTRLAVIALFCALAIRKIRSTEMLVLSAIIVTTLSVAINQIVAASFDPLEAYFAHLAVEALYVFPYPFWVTTLAYLTFGEAVVGAALAAWLAWDHLPGSAVVRMGWLAVIVTAIKGLLIGGFLYPAFMDTGFVQGVLSYSQFVLEFIGLGLFVGWSWHKFGVRTSAERDQATGRI